MKKQLLVIVFICFTSISWGQINEFGFFIGGSNYIGDVGKTNYILPNKVAGGIIYKYNLNPRIALRGTINYIPITADDANSSNEIRVYRNFDFTNSIKEIAVGIEYNFFDYDMTSYDKMYSPYIFVGVAGFNYSTVNAEVTPGAYSFKTKTSYTIPFGIGFKGKLINNIGFAIETKVNYTLEDDLDFTTSKIPSLDFAGNGNDWYVFTGISLVYAWGRPSCYVEAR